MTAETINAPQAQLMMERLLIDMTTGAHIVKSDGSQMRVEDL